MVGNKKHCQGLPERDAAPVGRLDVEPLSDPEPPSNTLETCATAWGAFATAALAGTAAPTARAAAATLVARTRPTTRRRRGEAATVRGVNSSCSSVCIDMAIPLSGMA